VLVKFVKVFLAFFLFFNVTTVSATDYDDDIIEIFSKLLPRFVVMNDHAINHQIDICVLHEDIDKSIVQLLADKIAHNYPQGLKNYKIKVTPAEFTNLSSCKNSELMFFFNTSQTRITNALVYANKQKSLTVSYDASLLLDGMEVSLYLGRKTIPFINIGALKKNGIVLDPILLRISKLYIETDK
jgi:hypothetical protein